MKRLGKAARVGGIWIGAIWLLMITGGCTASIGGGARQVRGSYGGVNEKFILPIYGLNLGSQVTVTGVEQPLFLYTEFSGFQLAPNEKVLPECEVKGQFWAAEAGAQYTLITVKDFSALNLRLGLEAYYGEYEFEGVAYSLIRVRDSDHFLGFGLKPGIGGQVPFLGNDKWHLDWNIYHAFPLAVESNLADVEPEGWGGGLTLRIPVGVER